MQRRINLPETTISPGAYVLLAFMILLLPLRWIAGMVISAAVHECGHILAVRLCGGKIRSVEIGASGAVIDAKSLDPLRSLLCTAAGPLFGGILILLYRWFPVLAFCALVQSAVNLLPVLPLDGGRILRFAAELSLPPEFAARVCGWVEGGCLALLICVGLYGMTVLRLGPAAIVLPVLLMAKGRKFPLQRIERGGTIVLP